TVSCSMGAGQAAIRCLRKWKRFGGTFENLARSLNKPISADGMDGASDEFAVPVKRPQEAVDVQALGLSSEAAFKLTWGSWFQRWRDVTRNATNGTASISSTSGPSPATVDFAPSKVLGQWPTSDVPAHPEVVRSGPWKISGGIAWFKDLAQLPPQFIVTQIDLSMSGSASFSASGLYLVKQ
ncbi:MAG: hypothetical protein ACREIG_08595, partial [Nitrospiraceae bacterium]